MQHPRNKAESNARMELSSRLAGWVRLPARANRLYKRMWRKGMRAQSRIELAEGLEDYREESYPEEAEPCGFCGSRNHPGCCYEGSHQVSATVKTCDEDHGVGWMYQVVASEDWYEPTFTIGIFDSMKEANSVAHEVAADHGWDFWDVAVYPIRINTRYW